MSRSSPSFLKQPILSLSAKQATQEFGSASSAILDMNEIFVSKLQWERNLVFRIFG